MVDNPEKGDFADTDPFLTEAERKIQRELRPINWKREFGKDVLPGRKNYQEELEPIDWDEEFKK